MTDLARLVVALEAQSAKYQAELDKANKRLTRFESDQNKSLRRIDAGFRKFGQGLGNVLGTVLAGFTIKGVIDATREAEEALALLDNAVVATGGSAGRTTSQLAQMAGELMNVSTFTDETIMGAQQLLLRFQSIQGVRFDRALQSALDVATVLRMDLASAATLVGKALEDPLKGMTQLERRGITFSKEQEKVIKALVDTGRTADAQTILLQRLEERFGGAAEAASNTFGGALTRLKNTAGELLEVKGGLPGLTDSINDLSDLLSSPEIQEGFAILLKGLADAAALAVRATGKIVDFTTAVAEGVARLAPGDQSLAVEFWDDKKLKRQQAEMMRVIEIVRGQLTDVELQASRALKVPDTGEIGGWDNAIVRLAKYEAHLKRINASLETRARSATVLAPANPATATTTTNTPIVVPVELEFVEVTAEKIAKSSQYQDWLEQLNDATKTELEKQIDFLNEFEAKLTVLQMEGLDPAIAAERWQEALDSILQEIEPAGEKIGDKLLKQFEKVSVFMEQAFRNTTDILAGFLENAMGGSFDNVLDDFLKMINAMVSQMIAANIGQWLFGAGGKGGGALSSAFNFIGGLFSRDSGGRGKRGQGYLIGTGAQPEMFVPDEPGTFYPADQWMGGRGGGGVQQNIYLQGRPDQRSARQMALEAARLQRTANARLG